MSAKMVKNKLPQMLAAMNALAKSEVLVGIPSDSSKNVRDDAPITNAEIGYINEFGAPELNIPPRPFLIPGVQAAWPDAEKYLTKGARSALTGQGDAMNTISKALNGAGLLAQGYVVQEINDGLEPQLAASTLASRKANGFAGEKPLIVTGNLKASITYVVKAQ
jgi:hypothetical protein